VLTRDAETRRLSAAAAARHRALLGGSRRAARTALFKKIDSTLRGQPAAELAASPHVLRDQGQRALARQYGAASPRPRLRREGS
jgi:hypothetical protein